MQSIIFTNKLYNKYMQIALNYALMAYQVNEIPVGAIIINKKTHIIASAHNKTISSQTITSHAEILAINQCNINTLQECTIIITMLPCIMCLGAIFESKIRRIIYGTTNYSIIDLPLLERIINMQSYYKYNNIEFIGNILAHDSNKLISGFFHNKRWRV